MSENKDNSMYNDPIEFAGWLAENDHHLSWEAALEFPSLLKINYGSMVSITANFAVMRQRYHNDVDKSWPVFVGLNPVAVKFEQVFRSVMLYDDSTFSEFLGRIMQIKAILQDMSYMEREHHIAQYYRKETENEN